MTGDKLRTSVLTLRLGLGMIALSLALIVGAADRFTYRYIDAEGNTVLDDHVPPEAVSRGYTVLGPDGRVVEEVAPAPDSDTAASRRAEQQERERLREWDTSLLRRYSSVEDIRAARERALGEIKVRIDILRSNLMSAKSQIEREQSRAADLERRGVEVPEELLDNIEVMQGEIEDTEEAIESRHREMDEVREEYQRDIERFRELQGRVEMRRRGS